MNAPATLSDRIAYRLIRARRDGYLSDETFEQILLGLQGRVKLESNSPAMRWLVAMQLLDMLRPPEQSKEK